MTSDENKLEILKKVEDGTLSVEEGSDLIGIFDRAEKQKKPPEFIDLIPDSVKPPVSDIPKVSGCWKAAWTMIIVGGATLMAFSAYWVYLGYQKAGLGWGFWLSWIPFLIGLGILLLGWVLMDSPWLYIRVHSSEDGKKTKINLHIPLPLRLGSWFFRNFGQYMPEEVKNKGVEDMIDEVEACIKRGETFTVEVDDKDDGEQVNIYIYK